MWAVGHLQPCNLESGRREFIWYEILFLDHCPVRERGDHQSEFKLIIIKEDLSKMYNESFAMLPVPFSDLNPL